MAKSKKAVTCRERHVKFVRCTCDPVLGESLVCPIHRHPLEILQKGKKVEVMAGDGVFGTGDVKSVSIRRGRAGEAGYMDIVFRSGAAAGRFERVVRERYGAKRYTPGLGSRFVQEALGFGPPGVSVEGSRKK